MSATDLTRTYAARSGQVPALSGVTVTFHPGRLTAIKGPSGSGKSTLLNLLAGLDRPTAGAVRLGETDLSTLDETRLAALRLHRFGFVFQSFNLLPVLTSWQNVAFPMGLAGVDAATRRAKAMRLLERFGLVGRAAHLPAMLSGGERQRVGLARALVNDPDVLFADEPTGNLDSRSGEVVLAALAEVAAEGRTVIIVTHDLRIAERADAVLELLDGRVVGADGAITARGHAHDG
ncbi:MAG: ABC transporter ATP-binding protein [Trueperaceae bacterium]|nr:ABC transporter ATP-binding protein [Trueperaceae bacterium]